MMRSNENPWLSRYAALTAVMTLGLISLGGVVTSHEAGLTVPDWPTSYGYNMFFFPFSRWVGGIFYEHTHRLVASLVGLMTIVLAVWLWLKEQRRWLRWLGIGAVLLVIAQGVLGGLRVTELMDSLGVFHATLAQLFFCLLGAIALFTSHWWRQKQEFPAVALAKLRGWFLGIAVVVLVQLVIGSTMRHQHAGLAIPDFPLAYGKIWPDADAASIAQYNEARGDTTLKPITAFQIELQMVHRVWAMIIAVAVIAVARKTSQSIGWKSILGKLTLAELMLIIIQMLLGASTIWTNKSADIATTHVAIGATLFLCSVLLVLLASHGMETIPARGEPEGPEHSRLPEPARSPV